MWMPLAILAVLSIVAGWVNIPVACRCPDIQWLHHWLEPVFAPAHELAAGTRGPRGARVAYGGRWRGPRGR